MMVRFAIAAVLVMLLGACDMVIPSQKVREDYKTGGIRVQEVDWKRWKHWNVHVDVVGTFWTGKITVYSGQPYDLHACVRDDVLTIYSSGGGYRWVEPSVHVGSRTLEIKVVSPNLPVETCDPDGSPVYQKT